MRFLLTILVFFISTASVIAQNIGIGTTTPTRAKLEVVGVASVNGNTSTLFGSDGLGVSLQRNWPTIGFNQFRDYSVGNGTFINTGYALIEYFDPGAGNFFIDMLGTGAGNTGTSSGVRAITILNNGNTGIRIANPRSSLHVARGEGWNGTAVFQAYSPSYWSHFNYSTAEDTYIRPGGTSGSLYISQVPNGNVYLGAGSSRLIINNPGATGSATVDIFAAPTANSASSFSLTNEYDHNWRQRIYGSLNFEYNGVTKAYINSLGYTAYSDSRLKKLIEPLPSVLEKLNKLQPYSYEMINDNPGHKRTIGFIAQDVKTLFPGFVHVIDDHARKGPRHKDLHTMNYSGFFVIGIKALQEQYLQLLELQKENEELMRKLTLLEKKLAIE
ncbi:tail fiber domain-containing protein [Ferruginibacter sp. SUN002]|uniref:tail fiber domain-containing protein n=1 Tax=Ferruginibacter sp. SUN002 TaxID=2937789 RepID=UPI003D361811